MPYRLDLQGFWAKKTLFYAEWLPNPVLHAYPLCMSNNHFNKDAIVAVDHAQLGTVSEGRFYNPHEILGAHLGSGEYSDTATVRVLRPDAKEVVIVTPDSETKAEPELNGVYVAVVPAVKTDRGYSVPDYRLRITKEDGSTVVENDPYRYLPTVGEMDLYLFGEGRHERLWEAMGANVKRYEDSMGGNDGTHGEPVVGTAFTVWAPNAHSVRVVGDFNGWNGICHSMRELGSSGVWEIFIPGVTAGEKYKYQILNVFNTWEMKADPMERSHEVPPKTASIVVESEYHWNDSDWMAKRAKTDPHQVPWRSTR